MNKLSKRLGAVGLAAALAFSFMPATALAAEATPGVIVKNKITVSDDMARNGGAGWNDGENIDMSNVKKLYLSNTGYDANKANPGNNISVVAAKKIDKKTHYLVVSEAVIDDPETTELELQGGDYELDLLGNVWGGDILVCDGASLKITDSKKYKKLTAKGDFDTNAPDGYSYKIARDKNNYANSAVTITATTKTDGDKNGADGYDDTKLYGGYNLDTVPDSNAIGGEAKWDVAQGTAFYVGALTGFIQVGTPGNEDLGIKATKGTLTLNDCDEDINDVAIVNGNFTQNGGVVGTLGSIADSDSTLPAKERTVAKITINKTSGTEDIADIAGDEPLKKGESVKIKAGKFTGDNPAKLGSEDVNTIGTVIETATTDGNDENNTYYVGSVPSDEKVGFAMNGAVTRTASADTNWRIATVKNPCGSQTATAGTTLKAKAANRVSYAVVTTKITYTDLVDDKENKNQVSYDTHIIADGGYVQSTEDAADIVGTYQPGEEETDKIWFGGNNASVPTTKGINEYEDKDGDPGLGFVLNGLEPVEADDVTGNSGIVKDDFTYERSIDLEAYPQDTFDALTGLGDNVDTDKGITYFTKDPTAYTEEGYGVAVIDGEKWIISGDSSNFDKTSELAAVAKKATKSIDIKRVDGHLNDDGKVDNSPAGVAFEMSPALADTLKIAAPADVVIASTLDVTNGREAADNFYTVYVYGLDASLGAASDFGVDTNPVDLQDVTFTMRQVPAKAATAVAVTDIAKGVKVETATGIEYFALYDSADADEADYYFGATEDVIKGLTAAIAGDTAEVKSGVVYVSDGVEGSFVKVADGVTITADDASRFTKVANATAGFNDWNVTADVAVYRVFNPNSSEHVFITKADQAEVDMLVAYGWVNEGIKWKAPKTSELPVYRAYNPNSGLHYYTANKGEYDILVSMGWSADKGIAFYSAAPTASPIYCEYNPNNGTHNYTADKPEHDYLLTVGWSENAVTFYGIK